MKKNQSQDDGPLHQTVAEGIEFKVGVKSIAVEFTEQQLSAHAGQCHVLGVVAFDAVGGRRWVGSCRSVRRVRTIISRP